ncbi:BC1872 family protein [Paenibacillus apiarius]|uniref:BC1872 family protein n=1 Tax=Paenibacillus apiarius TaxID=46240 RepID=UPI003B3A0220
MTYTREQILSMPIGRGLDAIAANLSGYVSLTTQLNYDGTFGTLPRYSEDISAAFALVDEFDLNTFNLNWLDDSNPYGMGWHCKLEGVHVFECKTAPEAITKATILVMMEQGGTGE